MTTDISGWPLSQIVTWRRGVLKMTQVQCCEGVCSNGTLRNIERGRVTRISAKVRVALERKLQLPANTLDLSHASV